MSSPFPERLYRPRPPEFFSDGVFAWLDVNTNVVTFNEDEMSLRSSRDLRFLRQLDEAETYLISPYRNK